MTAVPSPRRILVALLLVAAPLLASGTVLLARDEPVPALAVLAGLGALVVSVALVQLYRRDLRTLADHAARLAADATPPPAAPRPGTVEGQQLAVALGRLHRTLRRESGRTQDHGARR